MGVISEPTPVNTPTDQYIPLPNLGKEPLLFKKTLFSIKANMNPTNKISKNAIPNNLKKPD